MLTETSHQTSGLARGATVALARFLFPSLCLACQQRSVEGFGRGGVCPECWHAAPILRPHRCAICDDPRPDESSFSVCGRCLLAPPAFERLRAAADYRGAAREILLAFKFRGADYLSRHLADLMVRSLEPPVELREVTAVPATRRARRGSDHAAETLGRVVAARLGVPFAARRLEKTRETERQSRLPLSRRESNVRGAFRARPGRGGAVLLVDDVATSGATARECASRLRAAGAATVSVWCFARASQLDVDLEPGEVTAVSPEWRVGAGQ